MVFILCLRKIAKCAVEACRVMLINGSADECYMVFFSIRNKICVVHSCVSMTFTSDHINILYVHILSEAVLVCI